MEHVLQIGVSFDEEAIIKGAIESASNEIVRNVNGRIESYLGSNYWRNDKMEKLFQEEMRKFIEDYKDELMDKAIKEAIQSVTRTKVFKERLAKEISDADSKN